MLKYVKRSIRAVLRSQGYALYNKNLPHVYSEDNLSTDHNHSFVDDPRFIAAYDRAKQANGGVDHKMRWRAHVAFWAARHAATLEGDFVECGVSTGFLMSGIMQDLNWNSLGRDCYLFDTFQGLDPRYTSETEAQDGRLKRFSGLREDAVRENFAEFQNVHFVVGTVPETLDQVEIDKVAYLSLDMNCTAPEIAAFKHFYPKLVPGGWIVLDDYAYSGYEEQHHAYNDLAKDMGIEILCLPTGQGLVTKQG